ncbi:MAG TPA: trypsin-like peptidase domain-containing protein [Blastocatellia bacterium]|nr:trypsin-like peptidase domain-containing protein [Blastocatellia bacterium]
MILTNQHLVEHALKIRVKLFDGQEYDGRLVGQDREIDLAVVKIDSAEPLHSAKMGDSEKLSVGDWVLAIGSPFGLDQTVTAGIISAKDRDTGGTRDPFQQFLQTDAAINPGNSGGPLINLAGEVVGINTEIATTNGFYNGVGFALPSSTAVDTYNQLVAYGHVRRGFLGISPQELSPQMARQNGIKDNQGVLIRDITSPDSPAARAGLQSEDIVLTINGQRVKDVRDLIRRVASLPVGSVATVRYLRDGQEHSAAVKLDERQEDVADPVLGATLPPGTSHRGLTPPKPGGIPGGPRASQGIGLKVETLTRERARLLGIVALKGAVVAAVEYGSLPFENGILAGDVVLDINRKQVTSQEDFTRVTRELKSGEDVVMRVLRVGQGGGHGGPTPIIVSFTMP